MAKLSKYEYHVYGKVKPSFEPRASSVLRIFPRIKVTRNSKPDPLDAALGHLSRLSYVSQLYSTKCGKRITYGPCFCKLVVMHYAHAKLQNKWKSPKCEEITLATLAPQLEHSSSAAVSRQLLIFKFKFEHIHACVESDRNHDPTRKLPDMVSGPASTPGSWRCRTWSSLGCWSDSLRGGLLDGADRPHTRSSTTQCGQSVTNITDIDLRSVRRHSCIHTVYVGAKYLSTKILAHDCQ